MFIHSLFGIRASILMTLLLLVACTSDKMHMRLYAGPERPSDEVARLLIPESLEVSSINGEDIPRVPRIVRSGERHLDLLPGGYEVVVYYDEVWEINSSDDEVVRSAPQLVRFELQAGQIVRLEHRRPIDLDDARLLARDMEVAVVDLSRDLPIQLAVVSQPAVVSTPLVVRPMVPTESDASSAIVQAEGASQIPPAAALLKFWWKRASPEERAQFRDWISE